MPMHDPTTYRHAHRIHVNRKHKQRDRWKSKGLPFEYLPFSYHRWRHMSGEKSWSLGRRKIATDTGYGIAYEVRHDIY